MVYTERDMEKKKQKAWKRLEYLRDSNLNI